MDRMMVHIHIIRMESDRMDNVSRFLYGVLFSTYKMFFMVWLTVIRENIIYQRRQILIQKMFRSHLFYPSFFMMSTIRSSLVFIFSSLVDSRNGTEFFPFCFFWLKTNITVQSVCPLCIYDIFQYLSLALHTHTRRSQSHSFNNIYIIISHTNLTNSISIPTTNNAHTIHK